MPNQESGATMAFNNVRISGNNPGDPREESDIRYNYNNLNQIICASTKLGGNQPMHHSGDGGTTWLTASLPAPAPAMFDRAIPPSIGPRMEPRGP